jgi:hypothetical protein
MLIITLLMIYGLHMKTEVRQEIVISGAGKALYNRKGNPFSLIDWGKNQIRVV